VPYYFTVSDISVSSIEKTSPAHDSGPSTTGGTTHVWQWVLIALGVVVAVGAGIACCKYCGEDEVENMGQRRRKGKGRNAEIKNAKLLCVSEESSDDA